MTLHTPRKKVGLRLRPISRWLRLHQKGVFDADAIASQFQVSQDIAYQITARLVLSGDLLRLSRGVFQVASAAATPDPAGELQLLLANRSWFVSHHSALRAHGLLRSPHSAGTLDITTDERMRGRRQITGVELCVYTVPPEELVTGQLLAVPGFGPLPVSDLERTLLDSLGHPDRVGGIVSVARFLARARTADLGRLVAEGLRLRRTQALRRLAYLLDLADRGGEVSGLASVAAEGTSYTQLDPGGAPGGKRTLLFRLRLNRPEREILAALQEEQAAMRAPGSPGS